jgi:cell shape-determining protein MreC
MKKKWIGLVISLSFAITVSSGNVVAIGASNCEKHYNECRNVVNATFGKVNKSNRYRRLNVLEECRKNYSECKQEEGESLAKTINKAFIISSIALVFFIVLKKCI